MKSSKCLYAAVESHNTDRLGQRLIIIIVSKTLCLLLNAHT